MSARVERFAGTLGDTLKDRHKVRTENLDFSGCDESESHWVCLAKGASWLPIRPDGRTDAGMLIVDTDVPVSGEWQVTMTGTALVVRQDAHRLGRCCQRVQLGRQPFLITRSNTPLV